MRADVLNQSSSKFIDELTPETLLEWNYVTCGAPMAANVGLTDAAGAVAAGQAWGVMFPGPRGEVYPCYMIMVGAFTTTGMVPQIEGSVPIVDASGTAVGLNIQLDGETTDNHGMELSIAGSSTVANNANAFTVGTHSGYIDATFWTQDWTDYDCVSIGFRKVQAHQAGHGAILAAGTGDPLYTDFVAFGAQEADKLQIASDLNDDGGGSYTDTGQTPTDSQNHRFRVAIDSDGAVTFKHIGNAIAGKGTLAAPTTTQTYSFDSGDKVVPYVTTLKNAAADIELIVKDIKVVREPYIAGHSRV
jgi:hypothetical protein